MPGADINHHVAGFPLDFAIVEHQRACAFEQDGVIDGLGFVHAAGVVIVAAAIPAPRELMLYGRVRRHDVLVGRVLIVGGAPNTLHDAPLSALGRAGEIVIQTAVIILPRERRRTFVPHPEIGPAATRQRPRVRVGRRAIPHHFGFAVLINTRNHTPYRFQTIVCHCATPLLTERF